MAQGFLLGRALLRFGEETEVQIISKQLSAAALADRALWVASDELSGGRNMLSRLSPQAEETGVFADHRQFPLADCIDLLDAGNKESEADIEGLDWADGYLWFTGSHSSKRQKPNSGSREENLERLKRVKTEPNRYLLGRIPLVVGVPVKSGPDPARPGQTLTAARLGEGEGGNALMELLRGDRHLGPFLRTQHGKHQDDLLPLASKENGFDIEGLAVFHDRLFLGLRGPVLRGWAMLLEIRLESQGEGRLGLGEIESGKRRYRKHFVFLDGLGVRELGRDGDDLLILAGPTMALDGTLRMYRLHNPARLDDDSVTGPAEGSLIPLFELPLVPGGDYAEGFTSVRRLGQPALLFVYDGPAEDRCPAPGAVFADLFRLPA